MGERDGPSEWKGVLLYKMIHSKLQRGNMKGKRVKLIKFMDEEDEKELLLRKTRALFGKVTPTTEDQLTREFLHYHVHTSPALEEVVSIIFEQALEQPDLGDLYARMCARQVKKELSSNDNVSPFSGILLARAEEPLDGKEEKEWVRETQLEIHAETDEKKREDKQNELSEAQLKFRQRKIGYYSFLGHLRLQSLIPIRIIIACVWHLLKTVTERPKEEEKHRADEYSIECAVVLLEIVGQRIHEKAAEAASIPALKANRELLLVHLDRTFATLEEAVELVSEGLSERITTLIELRTNGWVVPKKAKEGERKGKEDLKKSFERKIDDNQNVDDGEISYMEDEASSVQSFSPELHKALLENAQLRMAVGDMQSYMETVRLALEEAIRTMKSLEAKNKAILEIVGNTL
ncbi:hypothetical protein PRIPAC_93212, partial [Pristionchus pacificus]